MLATNLGFVTYYLQQYNTMKNALICGGFFLLATVGALVTYIKNREPAEEKTAITQYKPVLGAKKQSNKLRK